jgi:autotransporter-associated beta strand protein
LEITNSNSYLGPTNITAGTLQLTGSTASSSAVTVSAAGTIKGTGTVNGKLNVASGGTLSPGTSVGQLNAASSTWQGGGIYKWEISDAAGTAGSGYDQLNLTGGLTLSATAASKFAVQIVGLNVQNLADNQTFVIAHAGTSVSGFDPAAFVLSVTDAGDGDSWSIEQSADGKDLRLRFASVPEPGSAALVAAVAIGMAARRRRPRTQRFASSVRAREIRASAIPPKFHPRPS